MRLTKPIYEFYYVFTEWNLVVKSSHEIFVPQLTNLLEK